MSTELSLDEVAAAAQASEASDGVATSARYVAARPQDLAASERLARLRFPRLDLINERACEKLARAVSLFSGMDCRVRNKTVSSLSYGELLKRFSVPANISLVDVQGLRGPSLVVVSNDLLDALVERLFGGTGKLAKKAKQGAFSDTELRLTKRLVDAVSRAYASEWDVLPGMSFQVKSQQSNPQYLDIAAPTDLVVICSFEVNFGQDGSPSEILFCFPYGSIEPIRSELIAPVVGGVTGEIEPWAEKMESKLADASFELVVELGSAELKLADIALLEVGDVIPLQSSEFIDASVLGYLLFRCRYGVSNQRYAIEIKEVVGDPVQFGVDQ
jgi:flagellar motor switch protein FliM